MKRKALLISPDFQDLPGVRADIEAWNSFLPTPYGGAWAHDEIMDVGKLLGNSILSWKNLKPIVDEAFKADYIFIAFSGHGGTPMHNDTFYEQPDKYGFMETYIYLNDNEYVSELNFIPTDYGKRCTLLLDCCRTPDKKIPMKKAAATFSESSEGIKLKLSRWFFEQEVKKSELGVTHIYSTSLDHSADDIHSFTRCMIEATKDYMNSNDSGTVLSLQQATELAKEMLTYYRIDQIPIYNAGRRRHHLPFAVNV